MAKPNNKMIILSAEDSKDFIKRFNANVISQERRKECEIARRLFKEHVNILKKEGIWWQN